MSESTVEPLKLFRSQLRNPRFFVVDGDEFSAKGVSYPLNVSAMPPFTEAELAEAEETGNSVAVPTGRLSESNELPGRFLGDYEYDLYSKDALGSEANAAAWIAENTSLLESLGTIVLKSPRNGIHVLFFASFVYRNRAIDDWLFAIEEDAR